MITVRELIDLYKNSEELSYIFINGKNYKSIYDNIKVISFDVDYCYDDYELWIDVDPEEKREADNRHCNNPFD
jgi:DNA polymerase III sliding clamp (beta) subunit (PCNA family)